MTSKPGDEHAERFTLLRPLLFTIAYEILGSTTESDDVLQESYLRWADVDLATVRDTKSYLAQLVTRQSLNALRAQSRRREDYVGPWLPEPLLLEPKDASADVVLAESVSMAMLVVLETLSPDERAVFVLREVFGFSHEEIASTIEQVDQRGASTGAPRARTRAGPPQAVRARRPEDVDGDHRAVLRRRVHRRCRRAAGDALVRRRVDRRQRRQGQRGTQAGDGRGEGGEAGCRAGPGGRRSGRVEPAMYNNAPALKLYLGDSFEGIITVEITDGLISHFYAMRNPEKLSGIDIPREISRNV